MGYSFPPQKFSQLFDALSQNYDLYAPTRFPGEGAFSDTDLIRYGRITSPGQIELEKKSRFSPKEVLFPLVQTLFYFTEDAIMEPADNGKKIILFLRSCDIHAVKRMDYIYLKNGPEDIYYKRLRDKVKFALIGCANAFDSCFCVDMGTNITDTYDFSVDFRNGCWLADSKWEEMNTLFSQFSEKEEPVTPSHVTQTRTHVNVPENLDASVSKSQIWKEYDSRCINCGRCNFSCPTCTCFTMQDMYYTENENSGERRRVWASCMVDGFTDVAGGACYRKANGERMRFKVLHKVLDYKQRTGEHMCVGCGRCDDVCPEYISFSHCINKLSSAMKEVESR